MIEYKGVYCVPCSVNGKKVNMIFDTGAAMVSISQSLAESMLREKQLSIKDFENPQYATLADGSVVESSIVNIRSIKIGSRELNNIKAVVVNTPSAMLLFGQSAIKRLGEYSIKDDILTLYGESSTQTYSLDKWDSLNRKYINSSYGIQWALPEGANGFTWEQKKGTQKHTVFAAANGLFSVHINVQVTKAIDVDVWEQYESMKEVFGYSDKLISQQIGCDVLHSNLVKATHKSHKCLKREIVYSSSFNGQKYEEYNQALIFVHNNYIIQAVLSINNTILKQYPKDVNELINEIFSGLVIR